MSISVSESASVSTLNSQFAPLCSASEEGVSGCLAEGAWFTLRACGSARPRSCSFALSVVGLFVFFCMWLCCCIAPWLPSHSALRGECSDGEAIGPAGEAGETGEAVVVESAGE
jgi:hypothetical protein